MPGKAEILYRDDEILIMNKPSGMLVHRGWDKAPVVLVDVVRSITGSQQVFPVHRIDRGTSGLVVFALSGAHSDKINRAFTGDDSEKVYLTLVRGRCPETGMIDYPLPRFKNGPKVPAVTLFRRLATAETEPRWLSLLAVSIRTGRLHQVRRHLKHINHPVIGDSNYGRGPLNRAIREVYGLARLALHACRLRMVNPISGAAVEVVAPLPEDLSEPLAKMGFADSVWRESELLKINFNGIDAA